MAAGRVSKLRFVHLVADVHQYNSVHVQIVVMACSLALLYACVKCCRVPNGPVNLMGDGKV